MLAAMAAVHSRSVMTCETIAEVFLWSNFGDAKFAAMIWLFLCVKKGRGTRTQRNCIRPKSSSVIYDSFVRAKRGSAIGFLLISTFEAGGGWNPPTPLPLGVVKKVQGPIFDSCDESGTSGTVAQVPVCHLYARPTGGDCEVLTGDVCCA